jgi:hypothetical protein
MQADWEGNAAGSCGFQDGDTAAEYQVFPSRLPHGSINRAWPSLIELNVGETTAPDISGRGIPWPTG